VRITAWRGFLAAGLVATAGYYLLPDTERVAAASSALYHYAAAVAVVVGIRLHRPADPWPWYLIGTALLAFGTGDAIQLTRPVADLSDLCFLAAYLALTVALLRLVRTRSRGRDVPALLDALVVSTGLGVVAWQFLMFPYARDPSLSLDQKLTSIVLPLADVVLLAVLVRLWSGGGQRPAAYWLLGLAVVALLAADAAFGAVIPRGPFSPGGPIDAGYSLFLVRCGAAALHPSMARLAEAGPPVAARRPRRAPGPARGGGRPRPGGADGGVAAGPPHRGARGRGRQHPHVPADRGQDPGADPRGHRAGRAPAPARPGPAGDRGRAHADRPRPARRARAAAGVLNYDVYRPRKRLTDLLGQVTGTP
jgi:hypothetical protein